MSYIPDYRTGENVKLLNDADREFLSGYSAAMADALNALANAMDSLDIDNAELAEEFGMLIDCEECEMYCAVFDNADYIPEDAEIVEANRDIIKRH